MEINTAGGGGDGYACNGLDERDLFKRCGWSGESKKRTPLLPCDWGGYEPNCGGVIILSIILLRVGRLSGRLYCIACKHIWVT